METASPRRTRRARTLTEKSEKISLCCEVETLAAPEVQCLSVYSVLSVVGCSGPGMRPRDQATSSLNAKPKMQLVRSARISPIRDSSVATLSSVLGSKPRGGVGGVKTIRNDHIALPRRTRSPRTTRKPKKSSSRHRDSCRQRGYGFAKRTQSLRRIRPTVSNFPLPIGRMTTASLSFTIPGGKRVTFCSMTK